jgi:hypothetical protein
MEAIAKERKELCDREDAIMRADATEEANH